jgi:hypothetical protein
LAIAADPDCFFKISLLISLFPGKFGWRPVRARLPPPPPFSAFAKTGGSSVG